MVPGLERTCGMGSNPVNRLFNCVHEAAFYRAGLQSVPQRR